MSKFEELVAQLESEVDSKIRDAIARLGDLGDSRAVPYLLKKLETVKDEELIETILWTLSRIGSSEILIKLLQNSNKKIVLEALDALGRRMSRERVEAIIPFLKHPDSEIRALATWALGKIRADKTYDLLVTLLKKDKEPSVRANAAWAIGKYEKIEAHPVLKRALEQETDETVRYNLEDAISRLQEVRERSQEGIKVTVYECPKKEAHCSERDIKVEQLADQLIKIEIKSCSSCLSAKICQVNLIKKVE
jgi:HEAT repeat protein